MTAVALTSSFAASEPAPKPENEAAMHFTLEAIGYMAIGFVAGVLGCIKLRIW